MCSVAFSMSADPGLVAGKRRMVANEVSDCGCIEQYDHQGFDFNYSHELIKFHVGVRICNSVRTL